MAAKSAPRAGWESFARPAGVSQRRYEAVRAYVLEGAPLAEAAARFGYSPSALASLVRDFRAGKLALFAEPGRPGRTSAPKKNAARGRVIELRRQGLSVYEISARLAAEGAPLNRTGVGQILAEEGFGRLLRHPGPEASISPATPGRATNLPPARVIDFAAFPAHRRHPARRAAAGRPRPGRPRPARPGPQGRLPGHESDPCRLLAAVPAGPQAHRHPARQPRR
jgi:transposase-like protein